MLIASGVGRYENDAEGYFRGRTGASAPDVSYGWKILAVPPEAHDELTGDMGKDSEWLHAAADLALCLKDLKGKEYWLAFLGATSGSPAFYRKPQAIFCQEALEDQTHTPRWHAREPRARVAAALHQPGDRGAKAYRLGDGG